MTKRYTCLHYALMALALSVTTLFSTAISVRGVECPIENHSRWVKKQRIINRDQSDFDTYVEEPNGWAYLITETKSGIVKLFDNGKIRIYLFCEAKKTGNDFLRNISTPLCDCSGHTKESQAIFTPVHWGKPHFSFHEKNPNQPSGDTKIGTYRMCDQSGKPYYDAITIKKQNNAIKFERNGVIIGSLQLRPPENNNAKKEGPHQKWQIPQSLAYQPIGIPKNLTEKPQIAIATEKSLNDEQKQSYQQQFVNNQTVCIEEQQQIAIATKNSLNDEQKKSYQQQQFVNEMMQQALTASRKQKQEDDDREFARVLQKQEENDKELAYGDYN